MDIEGRLQDLGIILPEAAKPVANYRPYRVHDGIVTISGQIAFKDGSIITGKLGADMGIEQGKKAAEACVLNLIAQLKDACEGDLSNFRECIRIGVFVNSTDDFVDHPVVANGASDLLVEIFGNSGKHTRVAVGVSSLPLNSAVEIEGTFLIKEQ